MVPFNRERLIKALNRGEELYAQIVTLSGSYPVAHRSWEAYMCDQGVPLDNGTVCWESLHTVEHIERDCFVGLAGQIQAQMYYHNNFALYHFQEVTHV